MQIIEGHLKTIEAHFQIVIDLTLVMDIGAEIQEALTAGVAVRQIAEDQVVRLLIEGILTVDLPVHEVEAGEAADISS